jgi:hypothetical protein
LGNGGLGLKGFSTILNTNYRISDNIVIPFWMCRRAAFGSDDEEPFAGFKGGGRVNPFFAAFSTNSVEKEQGVAGKVAANNAFICPKFINDMFVSI